MVNLLRISTLQGCRYIKSQRFSPFEAIRQFRRDAIDRPLKAFILTTMMSRYCFKDFAAMTEGFRVTWPYWTIHCLKILKIQFRYDSRMQTVIYVFVPSLTKIDRLKEK